MRYLAIVLSLLLLISCTATYPLGYKIKAYGSTAEFVENEANCKVEYQSHRYLMSDLDERADKQLWDEERKMKEQEIWPTGGIIVITVLGPNIESANTKYWSYVVQTMDGKEILRQQGEPDIAEVPISAYWWNLDTVWINEPMTQPFKLYVIDELTNRRSGFIIYPDQIL